MSSNKSPASRGGLGTLANINLIGLNALGVTLGVTQITPERFEGELADFRGAHSTYNMARSAQQVAYDSYHEGLDELTAWLSMARNVLAGGFGNRWNAFWGEAGFVQPTTRIPRRIPQRLTLALLLEKFLGVNPSYEVEKLGLTAARALALRQVTTDAQRQLQLAQTALKDSLGGLNTAERRLRKTMRYLINILSGALEPDDPRWQTFGLNRPAMRTTPDAPTGLRATLTDTGILLECDPAPLATRYRWRRRIVGKQNGFELIGSTPTPMVLLTQVTAGVSMEFIVQAVNGNSQGVASAPIVFTTAAAAAVP